jgi:hypothetical protein
VTSEEYDSLRDVEFSELSELNPLLTRHSSPSWPHRLTVRTPLFQGGNTGSIPVGAIICSKE